MKEKMEEHECPYKENCPEYRTYDKLYCLTHLHVKCEHFIDEYELNKWLENYRKYEGNIQIEDYQIRNVSHNVEKATEKREFMCKEEGRNVAKHDIK